MSEVRIVSFDGLLDDLKQVLGDESLLFERFEFALQHKDEDAIDAAMQSLKLYPQTTREAVEEAILGWLFTGSSGTTLANGNSPQDRFN